MKTNRERAEKLWKQISHGPYLMLSDEKCIDLIESELNQPSPWVSVKDRLPEEETRILICDMNGDSYDEREPEIADYVNEDFYIVWPFDYDLAKRVYPTHWMPLPESPINELEEEK